jgi:IS30 family transposase
MNQEMKMREAQGNAERQRQHVKRKQETHSRLQCWISNRHAERLAMLGQQLEDSQASIIEQAIDLLYQPESADMLE